MDHKAAGAREVIIGIINMICRSRLCQRLHFGRRAFALSRPGQKYRAGRVSEFDAVVAIEIPDEKESSARRRNWQSSAAAAPSLSSSSPRKKEEGVAAIMAARWA